MTLVSPEGTAAPRQQILDGPVRGVRDAVDRSRGAPAGRPVPRVRAAADLQVGLKDGSKAVGTAFTFTGLSYGGEHVALGFGAVPARAGARVPLVGVHTECLSGEVLGSLHCDCGARLQETMRAVHDAGGILLYLRQSDRGFGVTGGLDVCARQPASAPCPPAGAPRRSDRDRICRVVAEMLSALGLTRVTLLTCDPDWAGPITRQGIAIDRVASAVADPERRAPGPGGRAAAPAGDGFVTPREYEVLRRVAMGQSNPEIAQAMFISRNTVKSYLQNVLQKLNVRNRVEAIARARELGIPL
ncbi:LuxR C-terminal-related transcriptional regulator [Streptomyces sp. NPDC050161]|uniref:LuxR C-terminal-related transcriptional regulator n=1 Tax=Streptomyces sp. NPDC050161 TaxID=3365604 RepID=UPI00378E42AB